MFGIADTVLDAGAHAVPCLMFDGFGAGGHIAVGGNERVGVGVIADALQCPPMPGRVVLSPMVRRLRERGSAEICSAGI